MKLPPVIVVQLVHISGPMKGEIQEFSEGVITIGRNPSNHVVFPPDFTSISRKHAEIIREGNQFRLVDQSANGTFINGKRAQEQFLRDGDVLMFAEGGPKVSFLTQVKEGVVAPEPVSPPQPRPPEPRQQEYREPPKATVAPQPVPLREERVLPPPPPVYAQPQPAQPVAPKPDVVVQKASAPLVIQYGPTIRSYKTVPVIIGKHPKCDFVLDHPAVLDQHLQIFFSANQYWVKDLTGKSLIKINNRPVDFSAELNVNDDVFLSAQGPVLRYLGEGRFAENSDAVPEQLQTPSIEKAPDRGAAQDGEPKGFFAKLKKNLTKD